MAEIEIGMGKAGRRAYGLDDLALVPEQQVPAALFMTDAAQACTWCNRAWLAFRGRSLTQELGDGLRRTCRWSRLAPAVRSRC